MVEAAGAAQSLRSAESARAALAGVTKNEELKNW
jgi:hypothetical protein